METFTLSGFPPATSAIHLALFNNITNAAELRTKLITAATTEGAKGDKLKKEVDFSLIDGSMIVSREHILTAIYQALQTNSKGNLRTPQIHSEILLALSPSNNIIDAIKRFGITSTSTSLLLVRVGPSHTTNTADMLEKSQEDHEQSLVDEMSELVNGEMITLDRVAELTDWGKVKKVYKLNEVPTSKDRTEDRGLLEKAIITTIATKAVA